MRGRLARFNLLGITLFLLLGSTGCTRHWYRTRADHVDEVILKSADMFPGWKIEQYVLSIPVPNDKARAVVAGSIAWTDFREIEAFEMLQSSRDLRITHTGPFVPFAQGRAEVPFPSKSIRDSGPDRFVATAQRPAGRLFEIDQVRTSPTGRDRFVEVSHAHEQPGHGLAHIRSAVAILRTTTGGFGVRIDIRIGVIVSKRKVIARVHFAILQTFRAIVPESPISLSYPA